MNDADDIVKEFLAESYENLDRLDRELIALEKNPNDREILGSIFRTIHTIKGTCGFLGFSKLEKVAHVGESLLSRLRDGQLTLNPEITTALLSMVDAVRQMLKEIESTGADGEVDYPELRETLTRLQTSAGKSAPPGPPPPVDGLSCAEAPATASPFAEQNLPAQAEEAPPAPVDLAARPVPDSRPRDTAPETIRVGVNLLDNLMTLVGELVLARNQLLQCSNTSEDTSLQAVSQRMNLIATELQGEVMKTRMQPIGNIWGQFPRTVRDVALNCGKQVRIEMEGKETELDKTIIEAIKDPLTHLVRNSVDHGIELPAERVQAGKDPTGRLTLRAFHEGGQVNIEISDEGAGLNTERIRRKAVERGVITAEQVARMPDREIFNLIFLPGFSTAAKVTNVSGRGVGMDVVKTNVEKIGGTVDLQSAVGRGTTVRVKIPLTLAIIPALVVTSAGDRYAIPQVSLLELVRLEGERARKGVELVHGVPVYRLRGHLLPLVYLKRELKVNTNAHTSGSSAPPGTSSTELLDFALARKAHKDWVQKLRAVLDNKMTMTVDQAGSHRLCVLGKWIYSAGLQDYGDIGEMKSLEKAHQEFHSMVRDIVALKLAGAQAQAEQQFRAVEPFSERIIELLTLVEKKVGESQNANIVVLQADDRQFGLVVDEINDTEEIVVKPLRKQLKSVKTFAGSSIMGDGKVALILDVLGLAQRASVVGETRDHALAEKAAETAGTAGEKQTFLLFAGPGDSRMAIPLSALARLEEFPVAQVEMSGSQWVTQYRGQILPLVRLTVVLEERRARLRALQAPPAPDSSPIQVLVLNHDGRSFGLVVERILDIVEDRADVKTAATRASVLYSVVIGERVTELLDIPAILRSADGNGLAARSAGVGN